MLQSMVSNTVGLKAASMRNYIQRVLSKCIPSNLSGQCKTDGIFKLISDGTHYDRFVVSYMNANSNVQRVTYVVCVDNAAEVKFIFEFLTLRMEQSTYCYSSKQAILMRPHQDLLESCQLLNVYYESILYGTLTFIVEVHKLFVAIWIYTKKKQLIMSIYFRWNCSQAVTTARHTVLFEDNCFWYVYPQAVDAKFRCENILRMSKDFATRSVDNIAATDAD